LADPKRHQNEIDKKDEIDKKKKKTYQPNFLLSLSLKLNHIEVILI
jgi:hypothetical protein